MKLIRYVIQDIESGNFYWKGNNSSQHGFKSEFENAYVFKTKHGAEARRKLYEKIGLKCAIKEVEIKLVRP